MTADKVDIATVASRVYDAIKAAFPGMQDINVSSDDHGILINASVFPLWIVIFRDLDDGELCIEIVPPHNEDNGVMFHSLDEAIPHMLREMHAPFTNSGHDERADSIANEIWTTVYTEKLGLDTVSLYTLEHIGHRIEWEEPNTQVTIPFDAKDDENIYVHHIVDDDNEELNRYATVADAAAKLRTYFCE